MEQGKTQPRPGPFGHTLALVPGAQALLGSYSASLWDDNGTLSPAIKELVFLRTSIVSQCDT